MSSDNLSTGEKKFISGNPQLKGLSTVEIALEIQKTDKVCINFIAAAKKFRSYKDITNSSNFKILCEKIDAMIEETKDN